MVDDVMADSEMLDRSDIEHDAYILIRMRTTAHPEHGAEMRRRAALTVARRMRQADPDAALWVWAGDTDPFTSSPVEGGDGWRSVTFDALADDTHHPGHDTALTIEGDSEPVRGGQARTMGFR